MTQGTLSGADDLTTRRGVRPASRGASQGHRAHLPKALPQLEKWPELTGAQSGRGGVCLEMPRRPAAVALCGYGLMGPQAVHSGRGSGSSLVPGHILIRRSSATEKENVRPALEARSRSVPCPLLSVPSLTSASSRRNRSPCLRSDILAWPRPGVTGFCSRTMVPRPPSG